MELSIYFDELLGRSNLGKFATNDIRTFLREMRRTPSGPLIISKLLANKIQSKSESVALHAFDFLETTLDTEVEGSIEFRTEIGRYRFLNEIIRILSPKYLGTTTPNVVRERAIRFLKDAAGIKRRKWFPSEFSKVDTVYKSLIEGGVISQQEEDVNESNNDPDAEFRKNIFERGENAILLKKLLQSKDPNDLMAANRLIKNLVDEEAKRNERRSELHSLIDRIDTSTTVLTEMLNQSTAINTDFELIEELVETCNNLRGKLGTICSETNEETTSLVQASENIEAVLELYEIKKKEAAAGVGKSPVQQPKEESDSQTGAVDVASAGMSLVDQLLMGIDLNFEKEANKQQKLKNLDLLDDSNNLLNLDIELEKSISMAGGDNSTIEETKRPYFDELNKMSRELMDQNLLGLQLQSPQSFNKATAAEVKRTGKTSLNQLQKLSSNNSATVSSSAGTGTAISPNISGGDDFSVPAAEPFLDLDFLETSRTKTNQSESGKSNGNVSANANHANSSSADDENLLGLDLDEMSSVHSYSNQAKATTLLPVSSSSSISTSAKTPSVATTTTVSSNSPSANLNPTPPAPATSTTTPTNASPSFQLNSIKDIQLNIEDIELIDNLNPVDIVFDNNITLTITFGQFPDKLPNSVKAAVITLTNKSTSSSLFNYVFQLLPPKGVQVKLMPPSCMELCQWKKTFLPPPILTQLALFVIPPPKAISSQPSESTSTVLKFILSYCLNDETVVHNESFTVPYY